MKLPFFRSKGQILAILLPLIVHWLYLFKQLGRHRPTLKTPNSTVLLHSPIRPFSCSVAHEQDRLCPTWTWYEVLPANRSGAPWLYLCVFPPVARWLGLSLSSGSRATYLGPIIPLMGLWLFFPAWWLSRFHFTWTRFKLSWLRSTVLSGNQQSTLQVVIIRNWPLFQWSLRSHCSKHLAVSLIQHAVSVLSPLPLPLLATLVFPPHWLIKCLLLLQKTAHSPGLHKAFSEFHRPTHLHCPRFATVPPYTAILAITTLYVGLSPHLIVSSWRAGTASLHSTIPSVWHFKWNTVDTH